MTIDKLKKCKDKLSDYIRNLKQELKDAEEELAALNQKIAEGADNEYQR